MEFGSDTPKRSKRESLHHHHHHHHPISGEIASETSMYGGFLLHRTARVSKVLSMRDVIPSSAWLHTNELTRGRSTKQQQTAKQKAQDTLSTNKLTAKQNRPEILSTIHTAAIHVTSVSTQCCCFGVPRRYF